MTAGRARPAGRRAAAAVVVALAVVALIAGCGASGSGGSTSTPGPKGAASGTVAAAGSASNDGLIGSASANAPSSGPSTSSTSAPGDFTTVDDSTPLGFLKTPDGEYRIAVPLESAYTDYHVFTPLTDPQGGDLLSLEIYTLPPGETVTPATNQRARIRAYNRKLKAKIHGGIDGAKLAGHDGFSESVTQPPDYHYVAYFVFGTQHLFELSCQVTAKSKIHLISAGCTQLQLSVSLS